jgi:hypothetical protein
MAYLHSRPRTAASVEFWFIGVLWVGLLAVEIEGGVAPAASCLEASDLQMHKMCAKMKIGQCDAGNGGIKVEVLGWCGTNECSFGRPNSLHCEGTKGGLGSNIGLFLLATLIVITLRV